jgi:acyl carrier protein
VYIPVGVTSLRLLKQPSGPLWVHAKLGERVGDEAIEGDITVYDLAGDVVAEIKELRLRQTGRRPAAKPTTADSVKAADRFNRVSWQPTRPPEAVSRMTKCQPTSGASSASATSSGDLRARLDCMPADQRGAFLIELFVEQLAAVTNLGAAEINRDESLANLGLDSLMLFELKRRIESSLHVKIPTILLFESPSVHQLAECVLELMAERDGAAARKPRRQSSANGAGRPEIAALLN